jgi:salicylate hydroxylase
MMQPAGLDVLDWLGLGDGLRHLGAPIDRLFGSEAHSGRIVLDVRYQALGGGRRALAVHRAALFSVLFDAAKAAGIAIETKAKIAAIDRTAERRPLLITDTGRHFGPFDLVIDALGSRSPLLGEAAAPATRRSLAYGALWTTLPWIAGAFDERALEQRYEKASVMIGVLPVGKRFSGDDPQTTFFWSLKARDYPRWRANGLKAWRDEVLRLWPATEAHSTSPQLGQGANMALLDVRALTMALEGTTSLAEALALYARRRRFHVRLYQLMSAVFTPFYQSNSHLLPLFRDWLVAPASRVPLVARGLARIVSGMSGLDGKPESFESLVEIG